MFLQKMAAANSPMKVKEESWTCQVKRGQRNMSLELWADWKVELPSLRTSLMGTSLLRRTLIMVQFLVSQSFLFNPSYLGVQSLVELLLIGIWWLNQDQRSGWGLKRWDCSMSADKINNRKGDWSKSTGINFSL